MISEKVGASEEVTTTALANKLARRLELVIIVILSICYISQGTKNGFDPLIITLIMLSLWVPVVASLIVFKKKPSSQAIKHIIGIGYGIFFVVVCITSDQQLVFTYAFPLLILTGMYCSHRFSLICASTTIVIALAHSIYFAYKAGFTPSSVAALEIELASTALVGIYTVFANDFVIKMNNRNIKQVEESKNTSDKLLSNIMTVSSSLVGQVSDISEKMHEISASSNDSIIAMEEVSEGTSITANSVQSQLQKTEEIQKQIVNVSEVSSTISTSVSESVSAINEGRVNVDNLISQVEASENAGKEVVTEVNGLKDYTNQMGNIVSLIQGIASKTSLLSLNASIEAARAGDAGRGFAVVATEISNLAAQTKTATEQISALIGSVTEAMDSVASDVTSLVDSNKIQNEAAHVTADSFKKISENASIISSNSNELSQIVATLSSANKDIIESIETISAISEETAAHSTEMVAKTNHNEAIVKSAMSVVSGMTNNAEKLGNLSK